jgi:hypothetical protein
MVGVVADLGPRREARTGPPSPNYGVGIVYFCDDPFELWCDLSAVGRSDRQHAIVLVGLLAVRFAIIVDRQYREGVVAFASSSHEMLVRTNSYNDGYM